MDNQNQTLLIVGGIAVVLIVIVIISSMMSSKPQEEQKFKSNFSLNSKSSSSQSVSGRSVVDPSASYDVTGLTGLNNISMVG